MSEPVYNGLTLAAWEDVIRDEGSIAGAALVAGISRTTLSSALTRMRGQVAESLGVDPPEAAGGTEEAPGEPLTPDDILQSNGYSPEHWELLSATRLANGKMNIRARPIRRDLPTIHSEGNIMQFAPPAVATGATSYMIVVESDHQAPHTDPIMDSLATAWWAKNRPDMAVFDGDLVELHTLSRHPTPRGAAAAKVRQCFDAGHDVLRRRMEASPSTSVVVLPGNHDDRVLDYLMREAPALIELGVAGPLSLSALLRLDELPGEDGQARMYEHPLGWRHTELELAPDLVVNHAQTPPKAAGQTARAAMLRSGRSAIVGDCHRQELSVGPNGRLGIALGCMCLMDDTYPAYMTKPQWQHGFATVTLYPDGRWHVEFATRHGDDLYWRDQRFSVGEGV